MEYFGLKLGQDSGNRAAHPYQEFRGVLPRAHNAVNFRSRAVLHAMCSMDLFPTENLPWPQNVYFIQCNLSKKKRFLEEKRKDSAEIYFHPYQ